MQTSRVLLIDWHRSGNFDVTTLFEPLHIDWKLPPAGLNCPTNASLDLHGDLTSLHGSSMCANVKGYYDTVKMPTDLAKFENRRTGCAFNYLFRPSPVFIEAAESRMPRKRLDTGITLGLHLRFGDSCMLEGEGNRVTNETLAAAVRCAARVAGSLAPPSSKGWILFAASDCANAKQLLTDTTWAHKWLPDLVPRPVGPAITTTFGQDGKVLVPVHTDEKAIAAEGIIDAWVDQLLLASTEALVITSGGNGIAAAQIGMMPVGAVWAFKGAGLRDIKPAVEETSCTELAELKKWTK